jgi:NAD+ synthase
MIISYYYANKYTKVVVGTSNKTELLTGFFTKYGDGGVDFMPFGDLFKTQIRQLAGYLNLPDNIINKTPSPGLFLEQTDEGELGIDYETLDLILFLLENGNVKEKISNKIGVSEIIVQSIIDRVKNNQHKRETPLILRFN